MRIVPIISSTNLKIGRKALLITCYENRNSRRNSHRGLRTCTVATRVGSLDFLAVALSLAPLPRRASRPATHPAPRPPSAPREPSTGASGQLSSIPPVLQPYQPAATPSSTVAPSLDFCQGPPKSAPPQEDVANIKISVFLHKNDAVRPPFSTAAGHTIPTIPQVILSVEDPDVGELVTCRPRHSSRSKVGIWRRYLTGETNTAPLPAWLAIVGAMACHRRRLRPLSYSSVPLRATIAFANTLRAVLEESWDLLSNLNRTSMEKTNFPGDFEFIHCDLLGNIFVFLLAGEFFRFQYSRGLH